MKNVKSTSASRAENSPLVEVLDRHGRILAVMPAAEVRRQKLCHRSVAILLYDETGRLFLRRSPGLRGQAGKRWDTPVRSPVFSGESLQDAATRALDADLGIHAERMRQAQVIPPSQENANEYLHVFTLVRPEGCAHHTQQNEASGYFFGPEELSCLLRDFNELVSTAFLQLAMAVELTPRGRRPL